MVNTVNFLVKSRPNNISLRQVFESVKKLRLVSTLKLKLKEKDITLTNFDFDWTELVPNIQLSSKL